MSHTPRDHIELVFEDLLDGKTPLNISCEPLSADKMTFLGTGKQIIQTGAVSEAAFSGSEVAE